MPRACRGTLGDERRVCILVRAAVLTTVRATLHALNGRLVFELKSLVDSRYRSKPTSGNTETWSCAVNREINYEYTSTAVVCFMSSLPAHNIHSTTHNHEHNSCMKTTLSSIRVSMFDASLFNPSCHYNDACSPRISLYKRQQKDFRAFRVYKKLCASRQGSA